MNKLELEEAISACQIRACDSCDAHWCCSQVFSEYINLSYQLNHRILELETELWLIKQGEKL